MEGSITMQNSVEDFLNTELDNEDMYMAVLEFVISAEIRNGEFECNEYIVKKMDHVNFIIFREYTDRTETKRQIDKVTSINAKNLIEKIQHTARKNNFKIIHENESFYYKQFLW